MFNKKEFIKVVDEEKVKGLQSELSQLELDHKSEIRILNNEIAMKISQATADKDKENNELKEKNAVLTKETEILTKAFENMGFDVKDMKDILNKLVDGIVSKNEIKVLK
jgi:hypothetical protein